MIIPLVLAYCGLETLNMSGRHKRGLSVNRKGLQALTLVRPTQNNLVLDHIAVLDFDNRLYICD